MMVWSLFIIGLMGLFFYNKIGSIIPMVVLPTTEIIEPNLDGKAFLAVESFLKKREKNCIIEWICKYLQSCNSTWATKDRKY